MSRKNITITFILVLIFASAICALVFPLFGRDDLQLGLDLQGGVHIVYQADLSSVESGNETEVIEGVEPLSLTGSIPSV